MDKIQVFAVNIERLKQQTCLEAFCKTASEERRLRAARYLKQDDQWRCLTGGILIQYMLRKELGGTGKFEIQNDLRGRPFFDAGKLLDFNISHSGEWVVGIISNCKAGIDIEYMDRNLEDIASSFYTEQERTYCQKNAQCYYEVWTLKESFIKAEGSGMSIPLDSFSVITDGKILLTENGIVNREYAFYSTWFKQNYYLSVCMKTNSMGEIFLSELDMEKLSPETYKHLESTDRPSFLY